MADSDYSNMISPTPIFRRRKRKIQDDLTDESEDDTKAFKYTSNSSVSPILGSLDHFSFQQHNTNTCTNSNNYQHNLTTEESVSPIILSTRAKRKTQTKLTNFFTPHNQQKEKKAISPHTALKGTPYHGLNVSTKNEYDDLSISEIKQQLQDCQDIINNKSLIDNLPDNGRRLKRKIQLLDEALIRCKARNIIRDKNEKSMNDVKERLNFNSNCNRNNTQKTKILFRRDRNLTQRMNQMNQRIPYGLAKNLDQGNLKDLVNSIRGMTLNPLHNDNEEQKDNHMKYEISKDLNATLFPHQITGYNWMIEREIHNDNAQPYGGIIADDMGLGKTMQMIALMTHKHEIPFTERLKSSKTTKNLKQSKCTLIVCPLSVMDHWEQEIKKYTKKGRFIIHKYHGNNRLKNVRRLTSNYNVIITTYGCIQSEWNEWRQLEDKRLNEMQDIRKQVVILQRYIQYGTDIEEGNRLKKLKLKLQSLVNKKYIKPILSQILFVRIVLDEAHQIKNYKSKTHKAICDLLSKSYWFMTATPIQNSLDDLFAALHFLKYKYYSNYTNWKQGILNHSKGIQRIRTVLSVIMLRRLKNDHIDSCSDSNDTTNSNNKNKKTLIKLPPKQTIMHLIEFKPYERFIYNQLSSLMNKIFCGYQQSNSVGKHFSQCLKMLLQLRQACNSLLLIENSVNRIHSILNTNENETNNMNMTQLLSVINGNRNEMNKSNTLQCTQQYMEQIKHALESGNDECPICLDVISDVSLTVCGHRFCCECLDDVFDEKRDSLQRQLKSAYSSKYLYIECPACRKKLKPTNITRVTSNTKKKQICNDQSNLQKISSKLQKLMDIIDNDVFGEDVTSKCVVFSQWTSMLDLIENELKRKHYEYCRLDGKMSVQKRNKNIHKLNNDDKCRVMLISLKAGGVGLNLVAANHVIMCDIWWNPAIEDQAADRVHRIGQKKNVTIHRIVVANSVEQKVLKLQEGKRRIAQEALNRKTSNKNGKKQSVNLNARDLINLFHG